MFGDLQPLVIAAQKLLLDQIDDQVENERAVITRAQKKIKRLKSQRVLFQKVAKEMAREPKPFRPAKISKRELAQIRALGMPIISGGVKSS